MKSTRRDIFKFAGGSALGLALTPAPWRLITDTALWSENWPGIPRPERGPVTAKFTNCLLCSAGCGVRARCVNGQPVALAGAPADPLARGALCPFGLTGHHLPYHPARVRSGPLQEAAAAVAQAVSNRGSQEKVAVLDLRPGRTASLDVPARHGLNRRWRLPFAGAILCGVRRGPRSGPDGTELRRSDG